MKAHKLAELFPLLEGAAFDALVVDIRAHGQREPVIIFNDKILDGRNRWRACKAAGVDPKTKVFRGNESDALTFVLSTNLHRRHLSESQRARVAVEVERLFAEQSARNVGGRGKKVTADLPEVSRGDREARAQAAKALNVSPRLVQDAKKVATRGIPELDKALQQDIIPATVAAKIASKPIEEQRAIVAKVEAGAKASDALREAKRRERLATIAQISKGNSALSVAKRYPVLYADPPWRYEHVETESRAIENQYPTMSLDDICALPVAEVTTDDAILFLWATSPKLEEAMRVVREWGFTYRTCACWDKETMGMGYYFRQQHELLLVATKGSIPVPPTSARPRSVIREACGEHSAKPTKFYELIEAMYPELPKLEMFCRSPRDGWAVWGNQSERAA